MEAVKFHVEILQKWKLFIQAMSAVLFTEFSSSGLALCSNFFVGLQVRFNASKRLLATLIFVIFQNIHSGSTQVALTMAAINIFFLVELFLYCAVGETIPSENDRLREAIYSLTEWHIYSPQLRRSLVMIIRQTEGPLYMRAFGFSAWECSLQNYLNVFLFGVFLIDS